MTHATICSVIERLDVVLTGVRDGREPMFVLGIERREDQLEIGIRGPSELCKREYVPSIHVADGDRSQPQWRRTRNNRRQCVERYLRGAARGQKQQRLMLHHGLAASSLHHAATARETAAVVYAQGSNHAYFAAKRTYDPLRRRRGSLW